MRSGEQDETIFCFEEVAITYGLNLRISLAKNSHDSFGLFSDRFAKFLVALSSPLLVQLSGPLSKLSIHRAPGTT